MSSIFDNIYGYIPFSLVNDYNKPCSVLFVGGCNLRCWFCHNKDLVLKKGNPYNMADLMMIGNRIRQNSYKFGDSFRLVISGG